MPVEAWKRNARFKAHECWTKTLRGGTLVSALQPWLNTTLEEGVRQLVDFSGKHSREEVRRIYSDHGIEHFSPEWWSDWRPDTDPPARALILPDERGLCEAVAHRAVQFLESVPNGFLTLHLLETESAAARSRRQWGRSSVMWLDEQGLLTPRTLLVHVNAANKEDFGHILARRAHVVLCPAVRSACQNPQPPFVPGLQLHFGTDAPLASGKRRLWVQAVIQYEAWCMAGVEPSVAEGEAIRALTRPLPARCQEQLGSDSRLLQRFRRELVKYADSQTINRRKERNNVY